MRNNLRKNVSLFLFISTLLLSVSTSFAAYHDIAYLTTSNNGAAANIETQNPYASSDYNKFSCAWVMTNYNTSYWAQVGWMKYGGQTAPKYYYEYRGTSGWNRVFFTGPSVGSFIDYLVGSDSTYMYFRANGTDLATVALSSLGFTPNQVQWGGEATGSDVQSPGSTMNPVSIGPLKYKSTSNVWTNCSGYKLPGCTIGYGELSNQRNNISSSGSSNFEVWDSNY